VDRGIDPHRHFVRILVGDLLVHVEQVAVLLLDHLGTEACDRVFEIEIDGEPAVADAAAVVGHLLRVARRDVARDEVAERRVLPLEIIVALLLGNLLGRARVALLLRHPDASVVAQALAHERELRLMLAAHRDARRVNLREARVREERAALCARHDAVTLELMALVER